MTAQCISKYPRLKAIQLAMFHKLVLGKNFRENVTGYFNLIKFAGLLHTLPTHQWDYFHTILSSFFHSTELFTLNGIRTTLYGQKVCGDLLITPICGSSSRCCHKVRTTQMVQYICMYDMALQFPFTATKGF